MKKKMLAGLATGLFLFGMLGMSNASVIAGDITGGSASTGAGCEPQTPEPTPPLHTFTESPQVHENESPQVHEQVYEIESPQLVPFIPPMAEEREAAYFSSWTPHWASDSEAVEASRIDLVQGLPGYSLIAGKHTLVAFTPYPSGMNLDNDAAWLDVYKLHPWGAEFPEVSHIRGTPVGDIQECDSHGSRCAEINFLVDGGYLQEPGDYWFVINWRNKDDPTLITDSAVAHFNKPALIKILFVPVNDKEITSESVEHYFSRMPFASDAIEEKGLTGRYWDIYPEAVTIELNSCNPHELCTIKGPIGVALKDYNHSATVKADLAVGIFNSRVCSNVGCASNGTALCDTPCTCTHEIGHLLDPTEEPSDRYATVNTCGYFYRETDTLINCLDWAYDGSTGEIYEPSYPDHPTNIMAWSGSTFKGFYTRHFHEAACIYFGGGCESSRGVFRLKTLDNERYLSGDSSTSQVMLLGAEELPDELATLSISWSVEIVRRQNKRTYVSLYSNGDCSNNYCPFTMLIGNPQTKEIMITDPGYYFHDANHKHFYGWCHEWEIEQIAAGIVTLKCQSQSVFPEDWFMKWEYSDQAQPSLGEPDDRNEEHWTPVFQWRVVKTKPYLR